MKCLNCLKVCSEETRYFLIDDFSDNPPSWQTAKEVLSSVFSINSIPLANDKCQLLSFCDACSDSFQTFVDSRNEFLRRTRPNSCIGSICSNDKVVPEDISSFNSVVTKLEDKSIFDYSRFSRKKLKNRFHNAAKVVCLELRHPTTEVEEKGKNTSQLTKDIDVANVNEVFGLANSSIDGICSSSRIADASISKFNSVKPKIKLKNTKKSIADYRQIYKENLKNRFDSAANVVCYRHPTAEVEEKKQNTSQLTKDIDVVNANELFELVSPNSSIDSICSSNSIADANISTIFSFSSVKPKIKLKNAFEYRRICRRKLKNRVKSAAKVVCNGNSIETEEQELNSTSSAKDFDVAIAYKTTIQNAKVKVSKSFEKKKTFLCSECSKCFSTPELLTRHSKLTCKPFICILCHKSLDDIYSLRRHYISHHKKTPQAVSAKTNANYFEGREKFVKRKSLWETCKKCSGNFRTWRQFLVHVTFAHFGLTSCLVCQEDFSCSEHLLFHLDSQRHVGQKEEKCKNCSMSFRDTYDYLFHVTNSHRKVNFCCEMCGSQFPRGDLLSNHYKWIHLRKHKSQRKETLPPQLPQQLSECGVCGSEFKSSFDISAHFVLCVQKKIVIGSDVVTNGQNELQNIKEEAK